MLSLKKSHIIYSLAISLIGFISPIIFNANSDSWNSTFSLSFTILGTVATILTLIIAILLFDKFGINAKFKERQVEKVFELTFALKSLRMKASTNEMGYLLHVKQFSFARLYTIPQYEVDRNKTLLVPGNFFNLVTPVSSIQTDIWLPEVIKNKMKFLDSMALVTVADPMNEQYIRLSVNDASDGSWTQPFPRLTMEMFNINFNNLLYEIEIWLKTHSNIPINLEI